MMPAAKHGDPQLGVDIHLCIVPPGSPVPLPTPHIAVVFDPFDYIPFIGATTTVMGMKRASAGTAGMVVHIPPGFPFADDDDFPGAQPGANPFDDEPGIPKSDSDLFLRASLGALERLAHHLTQLLRQHPASTGNEAVFSPAASVVVASDENAGINVHWFGNPLTL